MKDENKLMIPEKENIFSKLFKWISNIFNKKNRNIWEEEFSKETSEQEYIIPKDVMKVQETIEEDENSLEYLYKLSDDEVDELDKLYEEQMEDAKNEILKLESMLQSYKQSIRTLQENLAQDAD